MKSKKSYIVKEDGVPCAFTRFPDLFGSELVPKRGVLWKDPQRPTLFPGEKSAHRAAGRAAKLAGNLKNTLMADWSKVQPFINRGRFTVEVYAQ